MERNGAEVFTLFRASEQVGHGGFGNVSMGPFSFFLQFFRGILNDLKVLMCVCVFFIKNGTQLIHVSLIF